MYPYDTSMTNITPQALMFGAQSQGSPFIGQDFNDPSATFGAAQNPAGFQFGMNAPSLQMGLSGLNSLGNLWGAFQANKLAKDQLNFTKSVTNTNLNNSIQSYNTALSDRARARGFTEGKSDQEIQDYVSANRLSR